jgi:hypothetical protein
MPLHEETSPVSGLEGSLCQAAIKARYHAQEIIEACLYSTFSTFGADSEKIKALAYSEAYQIREILTQVIEGEIRHQITPQAAPQETGKATQQVSGNRNQDDAPPAHGNVD